MQESMTDIPKGATHIDLHPKGSYSRYGYLRLSGKTWYWYHPGWNSWEPANMYNTPVHKLWELKDEY